MQRRWPEKRMTWTTTSPPQPTPSRWALGRAPSQVAVELDERALGWNPRRTGRTGRK